MFNTSIVESCKILQIPKYDTVLLETKKTSFLYNIIKFYHIGTYLMAFNLRVPRLKILVYSFRLGQRPKLST